MHRHLFALLASLALAGAAAAQTPQPTPPAPPQPATYPKITVTGTLAPGTYQLVPDADVTAWQQQKADHAAKLAKLREMAQQLLDATQPPLPTPAPTPTPSPSPSPKPTPSPAPPPGPVSPVAAGGNLFLVVVETPQGALTRGKLFSDPGLAMLVKIKNDHWRIVPNDIAGPDGKPPADVAPYLKLAAGKSLPQLYIFTQQGQMVWSGRLPASAVELVALITKVGG